MRHIFFVGFHTLVLCKNAISPINQYMCIVIAKYFEGEGWVAAKNRDQDYVPQLSFRDKQYDTEEILVMYDNLTKYNEGLNNRGVSVISTSLTPLLEEETDSKDGNTIHESLKRDTPHEVATFLIRKKLSGNILVYNENELILIEGAYDSNHNYHFIAKKIPKNKTIARTNHGIWIPWAGFQRSDNINQTLYRISSETRLDMAEYVVEAATTPVDMIDGLTTKFSDVSQLNCLRIEEKEKDMRTTSQIMIIPKERTMYIRPIQSHVVFDFWKMNTPKTDLWVEILSNRIVWENNKNFPILRGMEHKIK